MSNSQYLGTNAGFYFTEFGNTTWRTYPLAVPLREGRAAWRVTQYAVDSLDCTVRQVLTVTHSSAPGTDAGAHEYLGVIRYDDDPTGLVQFLRNAIIQQGSSSYPLRYTTGLTTGTSSGGMGSGADVWLLEPSAPTLDLTIDRQRASFGDQEIAVRFRSVTAATRFTTASGARWF